MLSTNAHTQDDQQVSTVKFVPVDIDGNKITYSSNPAFLPGVLHELSEYYERTKAFGPLIKDGVVPLSGGKTAVDSLSAVSFVSGITPDPGVFGFYKPSM